MTRTRDSAPPEENDISVGRFETFIRRMLNVKRGGLMRSVHHQVVPVIPIGVEPFWETRLLQEIRTYGTYLASPAGGAANVNVYALHNPPNSGVAAVLEMIAYSTAGAAAQFVAQVTVSTGGTNPVDLGYMDGRMYAGGSVLLRRASCNFESVAQVPPAATQFLFGYRSLATVQWPIAGCCTDQKILIPPGFQVQMFQATLNSADAMQIQWYERALEKSEFNAR